MNELSPEARSLIERTRDADNPDDADRERLRARLVRELGPLALGTGAAALSMAAAKATDTAGGVSASVPTAGASVQGTLFSALGKLMAGVVAAGALGAAVLLGRPDPAERAPAQDATPASAVVADDTALAPEDEGAPAEVESANEVEALAAPQVNAPSAPVAKSHGRVRGTKPAQEAQAAESASTLAAELALLERAHRALRQNDPAQALEIAAQHAARFPAGALRPERLGVVALARCARGEDGESVIAQLVKEAPESPLLARVRAACGGAKP